MVNVQKIKRFLFLFVSTILFLGITQTPLAFAGEIEKTWPSDGVSVVVPPREFKLELSEEVNTADHKAFIQKTGEESISELGKLTKGKSKETYFTTPILSPGEYTVTWVTSIGEKKTIFTIKEPIVAPGGGNHRHEFSLEVKTLLDTVYTGIIFLVVFMLVANIRFKQSRLLALVLAGIVTTLIVAGRTLYSTYEKSGGISGDFWEKLVGSGVWSQSLTIALLLCIPFIYYSASKWVLLPIAGLIAVAHYGSAPGHPSIPYLETALTGGVLLILSGFILSFAHNTLFKNPDEKEVANTGAFSIDYTKAGGITVLILLVALFNFTLYSGYNIPQGAFLENSLTKIIALVFIGLVYLTPIRKKLYSSNKYIKVALVILTYLALLAVSLTPPVAAGI